VSDASLLRRGQPRLPRSALQDSARRETRHRARSTTILNPVDPPRALYARLMPAWDRVLPRTWEIADVARLPQARCRRKFTVRAPPRPIRRSAASVAPSSPASHRPGQAVLRAPVSAPMYGVRRTRNERGGAARVPDEFNQPADGDDLTEPWTFTRRRETSPNVPTSDCAPGQSGKRRCPQFSTCREPNGDLWGPREFSSFFDRAAKAGAGR